MEDWPSILPDVAEESYGHSEVGNARRTPMDSGRVRQQQRFTASLKQVPVTWKMTKQQYRIFQAWCKYRISNGNDAFTIDLEFGSGMEQVEVQIVNGEYTAKYMDGHYFVSATLEVNNPPTMSESELDTTI